MAKYLIHSVPQRMWYVNEYLIPSMTAQGISKADISIACDENRIGCLKMFAQSCGKLPSTGDTWHLQDDIMISSRFRAETERKRDGIICGIATVYDKDRQPGWTDISQTWYSFPCIRIPNRIATGLSKWWAEYASTSYEVDLYNIRKSNKNDDMLFRIYVERFFPDEPVLNLAPNIVEHIDYMIGGSVENVGRAESHTGSVYWYEPELTDKLFGLLRGKYEKKFSLTKI